MEGATVWKAVVIVERARTGLEDSAWELLSAARALSGPGGRTVAVVLGRGVDALARELASGFDEVVAFDDPRLEVPDGESYARSLAPFLQRERPFATLLPHTNLSIDLAPVLSILVGAPLVTDCLSLEREGGLVRAVRALYGGKVHGRFRLEVGAAGFLATVRSGAFPAAGPAPAPGTLRAEPGPPDAPLRRRTVRTVEAEAGEVDIREAAVLVAVGRGIEEAENLPMVRSLAEALGGELACSRPVVDKGWLPKSRQVGTSGVTVKPRLYVAVGISGSFQHVGGIKGSPYLVAVNKDPKAPIFAVADVGVVGDLFEVVPALEAKVREVKGN